MGGGEINYKTFFAGVFASGNTYRADTECGEGWGREGTYHKSLPDFLFNQGVYGVRVCQGGLEVVAIVGSGWECEKPGGKPMVEAVGWAGQPHRSQVLADLLAKSLQYSSLSSTPQYVGWLYCWTRAAAIAANCL